MVQVYVRVTGEEQGSQEVRKLLEAALKQRWPKLPGLPQMEKDCYGKPYFPEYPWIHFSLSHTKGCVCCALSEERVGIDVERRRPQKYMEQILRRFSQTEQRLWEEMPKEERERLFFRMWVLKESYVKADGRGLRIPLDSFSVLPGEPGGTIKPEIWQVRSQSEKSEMAGYKLYLYDLDELRYELAVCSREAEAPETVRFL